MPAPLVVTLPHQLGKDEAIRRLKPGLAKAAAAFPVLKIEEEAWSGDQMSFRVRALGQVASGTIDVGEKDLRLEVALPWLLEKFAQAIGKVVRARGILMIESKPLK